MGNYAIGVFFYMKRLALVLVLVLAVTALGGCRFAVVEDDPVQIGFGGAALAEEAVLSLGSRDWDDDTAVQTLHTTNFNNIGTCSLDVGTHGV